MKEIELKKGETIKIIGQRSSCVVITNLDGDIYNRTDSNRLEEKNKSSE